MNLYPLKFNPIFKERIWGGQKLKDLFNKQAPEGHIGESWELSDVEGDISIVADGPLKGKDLRTLIQSYGPRLVGAENHNRFGDEFPLLIKFIDAETALSVQLHPDDELARKRHNSFGKTEMWHILQAQDDSELILGFKEYTNKETYLKHLQNKSLTDILYSEKVKAGDTFLIEAGRVHAIGAGVVLAEIQQTSDVTYRLYDWDRTDAEGNSRELHTELALDAIDFDMPQDCKARYEKEINSSNKLVFNDFFKTSFIPLSGNITIENSQDSFRILIGLKGEIKIQIKDDEYSLKKGETILVPAEIKQFKLHSDNAELLEVYV